MLTNGRKLLGEPPRQLVVLREHVQNEALGRLLSHTGEPGKERHEAREAFGEGHGDVVNPTGWEA